MSIRGNPPTHRKVRQHGWKWATGCGAAFGLTWYAVRADWFHRSFDWRLFAASISSVHWTWVILSLIPVAATYYGRALRWSVFLEPMCRRSSIWNLVSATIIGFAAIVLFGRPGELVRPYVIAVQEDVPFSSQISICVLERIFDLLMALLLFGFALSRIHSLGLHAGPHIAGVLGVAGRTVIFTSVALLVAILSLRHLSSLGRRFRPPSSRLLPAVYFPRLKHAMSGFIQGLESASKNESLVRIGLCSAWVWIWITVFNWCLIHAFDGTAQLGIADVVMITGFISFGAAVQLPGIGGGIQVVTILVLTELLGIKLEIAASFATLVWIVTLTVLPAGLVLALHSGLNWRSLRSAATAAATAS